jgi:hypothetical protein
MEYSYPDESHKIVRITEFSAEFSKQLPELFKVLDERD